MNKKFGENNVLKDNDLLVKSRPCRMKRQKKFFDEIERETATRAVPIKKSKYTIKSSSPKGLAASTHVKKTSGYKSQKLLQKHSMEYDDDDEWLEALCQGEMEYDDDRVSPKSCSSPLTARQKTNPEASLPLFDLRDEPRDCDVVISEEEKEVCRNPETIEQLVGVSTSTTMSVVGNQQRKRRTVVHAKSFDKPPMILTLSNRHQTTVSYPPGYPLPSFTTTLTRAPPAVRLCSVCRLRPRKYDCSETKAALCSLECYRINKATFVNTFLVS